MSLYHREQTATISKSGTSTGEIDLQAECDFVRLELTTMDSCTIKLQGASSTGGTFRDVGVTTALTPTTTGDCFTLLYCAGLRYIKVVASAAQTTAAVTVKAVGIKN